MAEVAPHLNCSGDVGYRLTEQLNSKTELH